MVDLKSTENKESEHEQSEQQAEQDLKDLLQRTQASFENYRKQSEKRLTEFKTIAAKDVILQLLPIIDNFNLALQAIDKAQNQEDFVKGVELIYAQLDAMLEQYGVKPINTKEQTFDPYYHEALMKVESDLPEDTIIEEFQRGYTMAGHVIRHAKVKVSAGNTTTETRTEEYKNDRKNHRSNYRN